MQTLRFIVWVFSVAITVLGAGGVSGQEYPNKLIRIVVPEPGGSPDFAARLIAQGLKGNLGQNVIVDNRSAPVAIETVAKAPPDGYTILVHGPPIWLLQFLQSNVNYDFERDFSPITLAAIAPNIIVVHPSLHVKTVKDLISLAKARPGELNYGSGAAGGSGHLSPELFKAMAGVDIVRVPYKSVALALNDLVGGRVQVMFPPVTTGMPQVKAGKLRALAVTSAQTSALAPGLPTVAASGLPGYDAVSMTVIFAPAKTPAAIINRLSQEISRILGNADVKEKLLTFGLQAVGNSPEQFAVTIKSEIARMSKVIKDAGIRAE